ncbi:MAG TPA: hypothetical protein VLA51_08240, partial [Paracoccaceae bacterium]|nr:hypothetical protein [Paracoccaceae bacterium]
MCKIEAFGNLNGQEVKEVTLDDGDVSVSILNYGCVVRDWRVPSNVGEIPVVLGFDTFEHYPPHSKSFGVVAGR